MAIDTNEKKASLINMGTPWYVVGPLVATFSRDEFQHLLHLYSGILAASITAPIFTIKVSDYRPYAKTVNLRPAFVVADKRPVVKTVLEDLE